MGEQARVRTACQTDKTKSSGGMGSVICSGGVGALLKVSGQQPGYKATAASSAANATTLPAPNLLLGFAVLRLRCG